MAKDECAFCEKFDGRKESFLLHTFSHANQFKRRAEAAEAQKEAFRREWYAFRDEWTEKFKQTEGRASESEKLLAEIEADIKSRSPCYGHPDELMARITAFLRGEK